MNSGLGIMLSARHITQLLTRLNWRAEYSASVFFTTGADPGILEKGLIYIKVWGFALLILSEFS